ncbi:MAG: DUF7847 domain-containing protein [Pirellulaceae bacterium]
METECIYQKVHVAPARLLQQAVSLMGDEYWMFLAITFVGMVIGSVVPLVIYGPMACGIYLCYLQRMRGKKASFDTLFQGFDYFVESLIATLLVALASLVLMAPVALLFVAVVVAAAMAGEHSGAGVTVLVILLVLVPFLALLSLVVSSLFIFVYPLIVDKQFTAVPAISTSCRAVWTNLGGILLTMLLYGIITCASMLACGIGMIFFSPVMFGALAILYRQIFPERPPLHDFAPRAEA